MTLLECFLACLGLLLTPGPTNTLLALASATQGRRAALRLMLAEVTGYSVAVLPLLVFGQMLVVAAPAAVTALTFAASVWVAYLAVALWRVVPEGAGAAVITWRRVFVTTLLNPKGLLLGLFILPSVAGASVPLLMGLFVLGIAIAASAWVLLGALVQRGGQRPLRRGAAVILAGLAAFLFQSGVVAAI